MSISRHKPTTELLVDADLINHLTEQSPTRYIIGRSIIHSTYDTDPAWEALLDASRKDVVPRIVTCQAAAGIVLASLSIDDVNELAQQRNTDPTQIIKSVIRGCSGSSKTRQARFKFKEARITSGTLGLILDTPTAEARARLRKDRESIEKRLEMLKISYHTHNPLLLPIAYYDSGIEADTTRRNIIERIESVAPKDFRLGRIRQTFGTGRVMPPDIFSGIRGGA